MRTLGAVICPKLFPLATMSIKTHVSSSRSSPVSKASPGELASILGPHCPSKGQEKILDHWTLQETPRLMSISLTTPFWILSSAMMWLLHFASQGGSDLWHLPTMHCQRCHPKTFTRPTRRQPFHLQSLGKCLRIHFGASGVLGEKSF